MDDELVAHARDLVERNRYLTLGTVTADGSPWTSPVYFAADADRWEFYWVSAQDTQHSRNLAADPRVSLVVFDSSVLPYHGRSLYVVGEAGALDLREAQRGLAIYPGPAARGGTAVGIEEVSGASPWRLYRARAAAVWVLCPRPPREPCARHGRTDDHRERLL